MAFNISNTIVDKNSWQNAGKDMLGIGNFMSINGSISSAQAQVIGNYSLRDLNGNPIILPQHSFVVARTVKSDSTLTAFVGLLKYSANIDSGTGAVNLDGTGISAANANTGAIISSQGGAGLLNQPVSTRQYVIVDVVTASTTAGKLYVNLLVVNPLPL